jgi:hypothetical protein
VDVAEWVASAKAWYFARCSSFRWDSRSSMSCLAWRESCLCALRWIAQSVKDYDLDVTRIIVTGYSPGDISPKMAAV